MKYAKITAGIVEQVQPYAETGFVEVPDNVIPGMIDNGDGTFSVPQPPLSEIKAAKIAEIKQAYEDVLLQGFVCSNGFKMDSTQGDVQLLDAGMRLAQKLGATTMNIRDYDNIVHPDVPLTDVDTMVRELGTNAYTLMQKKWTLNNQVQAATTATEVQTIVW